MTKKDKVRTALHDLIFEVWKNENSFDEVQFGMLKVFDILSCNGSWFLKLSLLHIYNICHDTFLIATQTTTHSIRKSRTFVTDEERLEEMPYSVYFLDKDFPKIDITPKLPIKL